MSHRKQGRRVNHPPTPRRDPVRDAYRMSDTTERMDTVCDACSERFYVSAVKLRFESELELVCPYCKKKLLVQHIEYAVAMVQED